VIDALPTAPLDEAAVRAALAEVPDPEIPVVSVVDLGMVERVEVTADGISVELLPTFVGCPAVDAIRAAVTDRLAAFGRPVNVELTFRVPWTSERITPEGRDKLRRSGFAPPTGEASGGPILLAVAPAAPCPYCGSRRTVLENAFGPTQCRSIHYCTECRQPFEQFKTV
jgi:ring-1,2-phenylacetyl-CoA epoxidase subunit PaaD